MSSSSGASLKKGVSRRFANFGSAATPHLEASGIVGTSAKTTVACGDVTYNNAFVRTELRGTRSALTPLAAQLGR